MCSAPSILHMTSLLVSTINVAEHLVQLAIALVNVVLWSIVGILCVFLVLVGVVQEIAVAHADSHELVKPPEILSAEIVPKFSVLKRDQVIVQQRAPCEVVRLLGSQILVEALHLVDLVLQLEGDLVDLRALHVHVIDLVPAYLLLDALQLVEFVQLDQMLVTLPEFLDDELLQLHDVDHVQVSLDLVQDHDAQLVGDGAVAVVSHHHHNRLDDLSL